MLRSPPSRQPGLPAAPSLVARLLHEGLGCLRLARHCRAVHWVRSSIVTAPRTLSGQTLPQKSEAEKGQREGFAQEWPSSGCW